MTPEEQEAVYRALAQIVLLPKRDERAVKIVFDFVHTCAQSEQERFQRSLRDTYQEQEQAKSRALDGDAQSANGCGTVSFWIEGVRP